MTCPRCGTQNRPGAVFCRECGARFEAACPACGSPVDPGSKFCDACGAPVASAAAAAPPSRFATPELYTPKHLAARILTSRGALEGERKQVTVLFADLKGSMELLADRDPEEARRVLDPVLTLMMDAVHRYEGTVNQVMGDGIMALFGAPLAHEDHAVRACFAALAMQSALRRYSQEGRRAEQGPVDIRVGLNSGEVVVRAIRTDLHIDYSAIGQTTHLAARMEQTAAPGAIQLTAATARLAEGFVEVASRGLVSVKGLAAPVEVFELLGTGPARRRLQATAARGLTPFVGRERELGTLCEALEETRLGSGRAVAIVGEAGVGKSRLFWEFIRSERTQGWLVLESSSVSYGKATPYLPIIDLLRGYFQIQERDGPQEIRESVSRRLGSLGRGLAAALPAVLTLLDVAVDDPEWQALAPPQRRRRTLDAVRELILRESQVQPVLLVFEDLHWIDSETQALLEGLGAALPTTRILLLVNYRPEYKLLPATGIAFTELRIDALADRGAEALLDALLGTEPGLAPVRRELMARTEGNPFFLEESVRALVETEVLQGERGAYRLARVLPGIQVPATVQAILAARIDRLPPEEKALLQAAAVIGKDVPFRLLEAAAGGPDAALRRGLAHLQAGEFLYETTLFPDLEYTFKHALTHEVAYASLLQEQRRLLHARIVEAIEELFPDRLAEHVERLARHALRGEVWAKAVAYSRQAGAKAAARSTYREAVACFEQALTALPHLAQGREAHERAIDLRFDLRNALFPLGELEPLLDHLREAERLAEGLGDQRRLGQAYAFSSQSLSWVGAHDRAIESGLRALGVGAALQDFALQVVAKYRLGQLYFTVGDYRQGAAVLREAVRALQGPLARERFGLAGLPSVLCRTSLVSCLAELGAFDEARDHAQENVRVAEAVNHPFDRVNAYLGQGMLSLRQGDLGAAIEIIERAVRLAQTAEVPALFPLGALTLGWAYALSGRAAEGLPLLDQALEHHAAWKVVGTRSFFVGAHGEGCLLAGRLDEAARSCDEALRLARQCQERGYEAWALRLLGDIESLRGAPGSEPAEAAYRQALALAAELGMRPLLARCHLGLGQLELRRGRRPAAREHLGTAAVMLRELQARVWLAQAEAALDEAR